MARISTRITGKNEVIKNLEKLTAQMETDIGDTVEAYARKIANEAAAAAPERTGHLKGSIVESPTQIEPTVWELGSELPYATRQEFEHKTKKAFMRNAIEGNRDPFQKAIERIAEGG